MSVLRRLLLALTLVAGVLVRAQSPTPQFSPFPSDSVGHIFALNQRSVISETLPDEAIKPLSNIIYFFANFSAQVYKDNRNSVNGAGNVDTRTCNIQASNWHTRASEYLTLRGLDPADTKCATEREIRNGASKSTPDLYQHLRHWADILNQSSAKIANAAGFKWGDRAAGVSRFWYPDRENQNCTLWHTMGVRVQNQWYVQARITADSDVSARNAGAENDYIVEHVTVFGNAFLPSLLLKRVPTDENASDFQAARTTSEKHTRPAPDSVGVNADISRNLAFRAALADGDNKHQQAVDAEQASNTAILLLPLAMNLVPVALIADVNTLGMLLYTALTDVLTTVPLGIKGMELINIANSRFVATSAQITGKEGESETAVAEAWVAECRLKDHAGRHQRGVVFVVAAVVLMVFGVVCEFVARWWVRKRRRQDALPLNSTHDPFHTYGTTTSYQPFTAAALTLQNRVQSRNTTNFASNQATAPSASAAPQSRSTNISNIVAAAGPSQLHEVTPAHATHSHSGHCICACHAPHPSGSRERGPAEYDARSHPDPLGRKYH